MKRKVLAGLTSLVMLALSCGVMADAPTYGKVKYLKAADRKSEKIEVRMSFEQDEVTVQQRGTRATLSVMRYAEIDGFTYSRSAHPRWKTGLATIPALGPYAISFFFMKGKKHWLTIKCGGEMMAFRLDKRNYNLIIAELEAKTGRQAQRVIE